MVMPIGLRRERVSGYSRARHRRTRVELASSCVRRPRAGAESALARVTLLPQRPQIEPRRPTLVSGGLLGGRCSKPRMWTRDKRIYLVRGAQRIADERGLCARRRDGSTLVPPSELRTRAPTRPPRPSSRRLLCTEGRAICASPAPPKPHGVHTRALVVRFQRLAACVHGKPPLSPPCAATAPG